MEERELLHTDGLSVGYHGKELIKEIGISLKMGEIVTLIGPNGAGKSTILKTIAKQLQEICGSVYVENTRLCELPEKELAKKMSIVFTERITPELMTVATEAWYSGFHPYTLEPIFSAKTQREKLAQRQFFFWYKPEERKNIINELRRIGRSDLIDKLYGKRKDMERGKGKR